MIDLFYIIPAILCIALLLRNFTHLREKGYGNYYRVYSPAGLILRMLSAFIPLVNIIFVFVYYAAPLSRNLKTKDGDRAFRDKLIDYACGDSDEYNSFLSKHKAK